MKRQTELGGAGPAGSSRELRLDPLALPTRFVARDDTADGAIRVVELHTDRVMLWRILRGMRMAVRLPIRSYRGVAFRMQRGVPGAHLLSVTLEHEDPALSIPLYRASSSEDIVADWQLWARILRLPLLVEDSSGDLRMPFACLGGLRVADAAARRRRRTSLRKRRPRIVMRRRVLATAETVLHGGEREIIARN